MKICHLISIPSEGIYWNTSDEPINLTQDDGSVRTYEPVGDVIAISPIQMSMLSPQSPLIITFGVDDEDVPLLDKFVNDVPHTEIVVSLIRLKGRD